MEEEFFEYLISTSQIPKDENEISEQIMDEIEEEIDEELNEE